MKEVSRAWNSKPRGVRLGFGGRTKWPLQWSRYPRF